MKLTILIPSALALALAAAGAAQAQPFNFLNGPGAREDTVAVSPPPFNVFLNPPRSRALSTRNRSRSTITITCTTTTIIDRITVDHANVGGAFSDLIGMTSTPTSTSWSPELRITPLIGATSA